MKTFSIDLDLFKLLAEHLEAVRAGRLQWRISSSGLGLHIKWNCPLEHCEMCEQFRTKYDDPARRRMDRKRTPRRRGVLYSEKRGRKAGKWRTVTLLKG